MVFSATRRACSCEKVAVFVSGWNSYFSPTSHTCPHLRYSELEFTKAGLVGADGQGDGGIVAHYTQLVWAKTTRVGCAVGKMGRDWDRGETKYL